MHCSVFTEYTTLHYRDSWDSWDCWDSYSVPTWSYRGLVSNDLEMALKWICLHQMMSLQWHRSSDMIGRRFLSVCREGVMGECEVRGECDGSVRLGYSARGCEVMGGCDGSVMEI